MKRGTCLILFLVTVIISYATNKNDLSIKDPNPQVAEVKMSQVMCHFAGCTDNNCGLNGCPNNNYLRKFKRGKILPDYADNFYSDIVISNLH